MKIKDKLARETLFRLKKLARHLKIDNRSKLKKKRDYIDTISASHSIEDINVCLFSHPHDSVCGRTLYDKEHCIFHSLKPEKEDDFYFAFALELEEQLESMNSFDFAGFRFPKNFRFKYQKFQKANFKGAFLYSANLRGGSLANADLSNCHLEHVSLQGANLDGADLRNTKLQRGRLRGANLISANLYGANLSEADLSNANLIGAYFSSTHFNNTNLTSISILNSEIPHIPRDLQKKYLKTWAIVGGNYGANIIRSIEFPPEFHQAGISILNHFGTILRQKYPEKRTKVKIEQDGLKVTLIIETEEGEVDIIEKALDEYGLVAIGQMKPDEFINDPYSSMILQNKLEMARLELNQTMKIVQMQDRQIECLTESSDRLMKLLSKGLSQSGKAFEVARINAQMAEKTTTSALALKQGLIDNLQHMIVGSNNIKFELSLVKDKVHIDNPTDQDKQEVEMVVEQIHKKAPDKLSELRDVIQNVGLGAAGSIWCKVLMTAIDRLMG